jgi:isoleucyl-tRNA synthetase
MSKRLKNYDDPMDIVDMYSADALRYYLLSSPVMKAESLQFSNKGVDEVMKKNIMRIQNMFSFYEMYGGNAVEKSITSKNILDKWALIRLKETATLITKATEDYELDRATRPIADFVDELSTWYIRRSRDRFKSEDIADRDAAISTTKLVLTELSKLLAPSMPFLAEDLYLKMKGEKESVHLDSWPENFVGELSKSEIEIVEHMKEVLKVVTLGLEARAKGGVKVRQPLSSLKIKSKLKKEFTDLIKDEVNVKVVIVDEAMENPVELDLNITLELKEEGIMRDVVRSIQEMRKEMKLNPGDQVEFLVETDDQGKKIISKFEKEISRTAGIKKISFEAVKEGKLAEFDNLKLSFTIK